MAVADNLTDSLSVHVYQEAENLERQRALQATAANFLTWLVVSSSFALLAWVLPADWVVGACLVWGLALLSALTYQVARVRNLDPGPEVGKHLAVIVLVLAISKRLGSWIFDHVS